MIENLVDDRLILDAGDHLGLTATSWADRHNDVEYPLETLCPDHGLVTLFGCSLDGFSTGTTLSTFSRCHFNTVFAVGGKYAVKACQVHSWLRYQCRQLGNEIQRFEYHVRGAIAVGLLSS